MTARIVRFLDREYVFIVDDLDADLDERPWIVLRSRDNRYYLADSTDRKRRGNTYLHRTILERKVGRALDPKEETDHIDRNTQNNTRLNLRSATRSQNAANRWDQSNVGIYRGVQEFRGRFRARIKNHGVWEFLGTYDTPEQAYDVFKHRHVEIHGEFSPYAEGGA